LGDAPFWRRAIAGIRVPYQNSSVWPSISSGSSF